MKKLTKDKLEEGKIYLYKNPKGKDAWLLRYKKSLKNMPGWRKESNKKDVFSLEGIWNWYEPSLEDQALFLKEVEGIESVDNLLTMPIKETDLVRGKVYKFGFTECNGDPYVGKFTGDRTSLWGCHLGALHYTKVDYTIQGYKDIEEATPEETAWIEHVLNVKNDKDFIPLAKFKEQFPITDSYSIF
jgi:hypothetical protein